MKFKLSDSFEMDSSKFPWSVEGLRIGFFGMPGSGKGHTCAIFIEQFLEQGGTVVIFEPRYEWETLKQKFPVQVAGGPYADVPLVPSQYRLYAEAVAKNGISIIFNTGDLEEEELVKFAEGFIKWILKLEETTRRPIMLVIEESQEYCLSEDTECLTEEGWKPYTELREGTNILTYNKLNKILEWKPLQKLIINENDNGELVHIFTDTVDVLATPEHRHVIETFNHGKYRKWFWKDPEFRTSAELPQQFRIPCAGILENEEYPISDDLLILCGFIITDGNKTGNSIAISQSKPAYVSIIRGALSRAQIHFGETSRLRKPHVINIQGKTRLITPINREFTFTLSTKDSERVRKLLNGNIHGVPKWAFKLSVRQRRILFEASCMGDGTKGHYKGGKTPWRTFYAGNDKKLADQVQVLCLSIGIRAIVTRHCTTQWKVLLSERYPYHYVCSKKNIRTEKYQGKTWCLQVENETFVARRNGKPFITGNCPKTAEGHILPPWTYKRMIKQFKDCFTQGRKLNVNPVIITQRPQELNFTIRMLCNISFFGKFAPQDIGYIDRECLKPYRERGIHVKSDMLLDLPLGQWLVIHAGKAETVSITEQRKTPHGAITPKLEYVAPVSSEIKKTVTDLSKVLLEAIEKQKAEESAVEKLKRQMGELQKELGEKLKKIDQLETALTVKGSLQLDTNKAGDSETISRLSQELEQARREKAEITDKLKEKVLKVFEEPSEKSFVEKPEVMTDSMAKIWFEKLPTKASKSVFEFLLKHRRIKFTKPQIALQTGYKNTAGGTFGTAFKILKDNNLVKTDGKMFWCE
jgi:hypothetical protein